ncbi:MAG: hypothetical protein E7647_03615 [Ruminococcaceae bacterium]|nr:hypothetical protein [Oscillospiraceae bacterium]
MKDKRIDLTLFGEGEGGAEGCAAEQTVSKEADGAGEMLSDNSADNKGKCDSLPSSYEPEGSDAVKTIAFLLGLHGADADAVISELKSRRARTLLFEKLRSRNAKKTYARLVSEAQALSEKNEGFDLVRELSDRRFPALLRSGLSVEEAWRALHADELIEAAKKDAERAAVAAALEKIRCSQSRPDENGGAGRAPAKSQSGVESLSGRGIRDILRRVENGAKIKF